VQRSKAEIRNEKKREKGKVPQENAGRELVGGIDGGRGESKSSPSSPNPAPVEERCLATKNPERFLLLW
jgi:hypothetical protein